MRPHRRRWPWVLAVLAAILLAGFLTLDTLATRQVRKSLAGLESYHGTVGRVHVSLLGPGVVLSDLRLDQRVVGGGAVPFFRAPSVKVEARWRTLFDGSIQATVDVQRPEIVVQAGTRPVKSKSDWRKSVREASPFQVTEITTGDGTLTYVGRGGRKVAMSGMRSSVRGFSNVPGRKGELPVDFEMDARLGEKGSVHIEGAAAPLAAGAPRARVKMQASGLRVSELAPLTPAPRALEMAQGVASLDADLRLGTRVQGTLSARFEGLFVGELAERLPELPGAAKDLTGSDVLGELGKLRGRLEKLEDKLVPKELNRPRDLSATVKLDLPLQGRTLDWVIEQAAQRLIRETFKRAALSLG